jgi:2-succinyl-5-enolpyruvyl-6-hydroxy-3-cyclohexene-1-carboxylate synthase
VHITLGLHALLGTAAVAVERLGRLMLRTLLTEWSRLLMRSYRDAGVSEVIISPGARSLPFALAAVNTEGLRCHVALDERAAGFMALGSARWSRAPSLVLCTSGSAGAHYLPAIVEAAADHVPLIVLTADRPSELQGCGSPQTMDQLKLFGSNVRRFFDVGAPHDSVEALMALRRVAATSVFASRHPEPGPVHVNLAARKPLEPVAPQTPPELALHARVATIAQRPLIATPVPRQLVPREATSEVARLLAGCARGLIVCGALPAGSSIGAQLRALARETGYPICAEAASQLRFAGEPSADVVLCDAFEHILQDPGFAAAHQPELILQLGAAPTSSSWERYASTHPQAKLIVLCEHGFRDPLNLASHVLVGELEHSLEAVQRGLSSELHAASERAARSRAWADAFRRANAAAWRAIDADLCDRRVLTEGAVARATVEAAPRDSLLFLGNSSPIRLADAYCKATPRGLHVLSQRGLSGIDGALAGGWGSALSAGKPLSLLIGDLTFLHDASSLGLWSPAQREPIVVVVIQNSGGRIFEQLPIQAVLREHERPFVVTPHSRSLEPAARMYGARYARVSSLAALESALRDAHGTAAVTLIEAVVAHAAAADRERVNAAVSGSLEAEWKR